MTATANLSVTVSDCQPTGFTITPATVTLEVNSLAPPIVWSAVNKATVCGTYSVSSDSTIVTISGQNLILETTAATNQPVTLTLIRDDDSNMKVTAQLLVNLYDCRPSGFALS